MGIIITNCVLRNSVTVSQLHNNVTNNSTGTDITTPPFVHPSFKRRGVFQAGGEGLTIPGRYPGLCYTRPSGWWHLCKGDRPVAPADHSGINSQRAFRYNRNAPLWQFPIIACLTRAGIYLYFRIFLIALKLLYRALRYILNKIQRRYFVVITQKITIIAHKRPCGGIAGMYPQEKMRKRTILNRFNYCYRWQRVVLRFVRQVYRYRYRFWFCPAYRAA